MVSKIKPIPLRLSDEVRANIKAQAEAQGRSAHSLIVAAVEREYGSGAAAPTAPIIGETVKAAKAPRKGKAPPEPATRLDTSMVAHLGTFERKPLQKAPKRAKWNV